MIAEKWRSIVEPEINGCVSPLTWDELNRLPNIDVLERQDSVMVLQPVRLGGRRWLSIIVACGVLNEVLDMTQEAERLATKASFVGVMFIGRRGWARALTGYRESSIIAVKEL